MNRHYRLVALRALHRCEYCHAPESVFNLPFEVEHIVPLSLGGDDEEANLALSCRSCNLYKGVFLSAIDPETERSEKLFNPRNQLWEEYFAVNEKKGEVMSLSSTGRATVERLRMNSRAQVLARRQWIQLGLFP